MDYINKIFELLQTISDEDVLKCIYNIVKDLCEVQHG